MEEIWKPVPSKPGIMASSFGRLLLPERQAEMPNGGVRSYKPKPTFGYKVKASKNARHQYMGLCNKFYGNMKIHRLVCEAFHGLAPFPNAVVIHNDEDATNNRPDNLKWGTQKENLNMPGFIEYCRSRVGENSPHAKRKAKLKGK
jgi:hypothetical protein